MSSRNKKRTRVRRIEHVAERTKNMTFRIDMTRKNQNLYLAMAVIGAAAYLVGLVLYIYTMFSLHLGELRYAVIVVGAGMGAFMVLGFAEVFRERAAGCKVLTSEQITKGCDRVTNMGMAAGQVFLAVFLMEFLSRSTMPRWIPSLTAIGALLCYCGGRMISEAVKEVKQQ